MAKKKQIISTDDTSRLPQNILCMGEQMPEDKHIYISQTAYKEIHAFTKNKTKNESGGMLIGRVVQAFNKTNIIINGFVEAKNTESTPTTLTFTHETWTACHKTIDKVYPGQKIVGWIHTHPNFGVFLSNHDKFIQESTFNDENQVALVVDPIRGEEGFFCWLNGNIERCSGFYIFEKNGKPITVSNSKKESVQNRADADSGLVWKVLTGILTVAVILLMFFTISINKRMTEMRKTMDSYEGVYEALAPYFNQGNVIIVPEISESAPIDSGATDTGETMPLPEPDTDTAEVESEETP